MWHVERSRSGTRSYQCLQVYGFLRIFRGFSGANTGVQNYHEIYGHHLWEVYGLLIPMEIQATNEPHCMVTRVLPFSSFSFPHPFQFFFFNGCTQILSHTYNESILLGRTILNSWVMCCPSLLSGQYCIGANCTDVVGTLTIRKLLSPVPSCPLSLPMEASPKSLFQQLPN